MGDGPELTQRDPQEIFAEITNEPGRAAIVAQSLRDNPLVTKMEAKRLDNEYGPETREFYLFAGRIISDTSAFLSLEFDPEVEELAEALASGLTRPASAFGMDSAETRQKQKDYVAKNRAGYILAQAVFAKRTQLLAQEAQEALPEIPAVA